MIGSKDQISAYYDYTLNFYKVFWHGETRALHYGIWDSSTTTLSDALLNANRVLADFAELQSGERVLDAGCGVGGSCFWLARHRSVPVVGISLSKRQIQKAEELRVRLNLENQTQFLLQDYVHTDFPDASFDIVWAIESVCHAEDKGAFLREAYRLLRPGGRLAISDAFLARPPQRASETRQLDSFFRGIVVPNLETIERMIYLAKQAGFIKIKHADLTNQALPTSRIMWRMSSWSWPLSVVTTFLRLTPRLLRDNNRAGIDQYSLVSNGVLTYNIFIAEK